MVNPDIPAAKTYVTRYGSTAYGLTRYFLASNVEPDAWYKDAKGNLQPLWLVSTVLEHAPEQDQDQVA